MPAKHAVKDLLKYLDDQEIEFVTFRFSNLSGGLHQITLPRHQVDSDLLTNGSNFDGSSVPGWRPINNSDVYFMPDAEATYLDPFAAHPTLIVFCQVKDPATGETYNRDPRSIAKKAEAFLAQSNMGDQAFFGPELEFFVFDNILYENAPHKSMYQIDAVNAPWSTGQSLEEGNTGHVPGFKGGYFAAAPRDRLQDIRAEICQTLDKLGIESQLHHHEVATAGQCEVGAAFNTATRKADEVQMTKYVVHNACDVYGKTATFMPKPIDGDNGSGMHVHQSVWKQGKNTFAGDEFAGLSEQALYYIGGIIKHAHALNAFTNPTTNSYKRLIPGFEAPVILAYGAANRSASIRIPASHSAKAKRMEVRFPDATANPYLAFAAMLMAGLDGIENKIHPGEAQTADLYQADTPNLPEVCGTLDEALRALDNDRSFLTKGDVFTDDMLNSYIDIKKQEVTKLNQTPHPIEFAMYYSA